MPDKVTDVVDAILDHCRPESTIKFDRECREQRLDVTSDERTHSKYVHPGAQGVQYNAPKRIMKNVTP